MLGDEIILKAIARLIYRLLGASSPGAWESQEGWVEVLIKMKQGYNYLCWERILPKLKPASLP